MAALSAEIAVNGCLSAEIESCIYEISLGKIIHVFLNFRRVLCSTSPQRAWLDKSSEVYILVYEANFSSKKISKNHTSKQPTNGLKFNIFHSWGPNLEMKFIV